MHYHHRFHSFLAVNSDQKLAFGPFLLFQKKRKMLDRPKFTLAST